MNSIQWPEAYRPGWSDNFASNEVIVPGLTVAQVWPFLIQPDYWPTYYPNSENIAFHGNGGPILSLNARFYFETFGFPVEAQVVELEDSCKSGCARLAWHGWSGEAEDRLDVHHAWLLEELPWGCLRILTQETQNGKPAKALARTRPNPMINGHQDWLDGLVSIAQKSSAKAG